MNEVGLSKKVPSLLIANCDVSRAAAFLAKLILSEPLINSSSLVDVASKIWRFFQGILE